ncbi:MAG TPA: MFS transporter [Acidimicrobiales bacterium]|nr:MFS transporter [Acidimicrobiales bacterium]
MSAPGSAPESGSLRLRALVPSLYAPAFLYSVGQGALVPVIALAARREGASVALAGAVVGLRGIGICIGDVPAGKLVSRLGQRVSTIVASVVMVVAGGAAALSASVWVLALSVLVMGFGWAAWLVARLSLATDLAPEGRRGQVIAALGGSSRIGNFVGPLIGAGLITAFGIDAAFWLQGVMVVIGCAALLVFCPPGAAAGNAGRDHGGVLSSLSAAGVRRVAGPAVGAVAICALRSSRQALLPLWASHIGVDAAGVSLVFGVSSGLDMLLFAPAGYASDRWGRKVVALSCLAVLAVGHLLIPLTGDFTGLMAVGLLLGFGNGLGSGIVMTMGADLAPPVGRPAFLGLWRFVADVGTAGGPFVVSAVAALTALMPAAIAVGAVGLVVAVGLRARMPDPSPGAVAR